MEVMEVITLLTLLCNVIYGTAHLCFLYFQSKKSNRPSLGT